MAESSLEKLERFLKDRLPINDVDSYLYQLNLNDFQASLVIEIVEIICATSKGRIEGK